MSHLDRRGQVWSSVHNCLGLVVRPPREGSLTSGVWHDILVLEASWPSANVVGDIVTWYEVAPSEWERAAHVRRIA